MRVLLSKILVLIMLFFMGCQSGVFQTQSDLPQSEHIDVHWQDYEIQPQRVSCIDSLGIWECYMETEIASSNRFYFDNGKLKMWGH